MFKINKNNTLPDTVLEIDDKKISIPCFILSNNSSFISLFEIESIEEEVVDIEDFSFAVSTIPSNYQIVELDIITSKDTDGNLQTIYFNGTKYQNLLTIDGISNLDSLSVEEREST